MKEKYVQRLPFGIINCGDSMTNDKETHGEEKDVRSRSDARGLFLWYDSMSLRHPENHICIDYL